MRDQVGGDEPWLAVVAKDKPLGRPSQKINSAVEGDNFLGGGYKEIPWTDDLVYAADMLVPFIPLHQEGKCEIVPRSDWRSGVWRSLKAVYSVTGWAIFSLALVTFSGLLKRFDRDAA